MGKIKIIPDAVVEDQIFSVMGAEKKIKAISIHRKIRKYYNCWIKASQFKRVLQSLVSWGSVERTKDKHYIVPLPKKAN